MEEIHAGERRGQRQRHGDAGDECRPEAPQENKDHHHHQRDAQQQRELHFLDRGPDRLGAIADGINLDRRRQPFGQVREFGLNAIHRLNNIGLRLFENDYYHRLIGSGPPGLARILHASNHAADRAELDWAGHLLGEDKILIIVHLKQLIVAVDGKGRFFAIEAALGHVHIDLPKHGTHVLHAHSG